MINTIIDGLTATIGAQFPNCEIYTENVKQGLKEPCFYITVLEPSQKQLLNYRTLLTVPVDVHYFPEEGKHEINRVAIILMKTLRRINLLSGELANGYNLHYEIVDNVLHFLATYQATILYKPEPEELMEVIEEDNMKVGTKNG